MEGNGGGKAGMDLWEGRALIFVSGGSEAREGGGQGGGRRGRHGINGTGEGNHRFPLLLRETEGRGGVTCMRRK